MRIQLEYKLLNIRTVFTCRFSIFYQVHLTECLFNYEYSRTKEEAYGNLVEQIIEEKSKYTGENKFKNNKLKEKIFSFEWCSFCKQINLWTYWQGLGCYNPRILLVGQDLGDCNDLSVKVGIETENKKDHYAVFDKRCCCSLF